MLSRTAFAYSYFSFGRGVSSPRTLAKRAAELGYTALALIDDQSIAGVVELEQAANQYNLHSIIGSTLPVVLEAETYPLVLVAKTRRGYTNLNSLITLSFNEPITTAMLAAHHHDLICLTGSRRGFPATLIGQRHYLQAERILKDLQAIFHDDLYVQLFYDGYPHDERRARVLRRFAHANEVSVVAAPEVRYAHIHHAKLYDALTCARLGIDVDTPHVDRPQTNRQFLQSPDVLADLLSFPDAHQNANAIASRCHVNILAKTISVPLPADLPADTTPNDHLEQRCYLALPEKYPNNPNAKSTLERELLTIKGLGLAGFFLVAASVTDFCRSRGIMAAGRGSAAGSVVCYLLGITKTNPLEHDLLFERFLHTGKASMPDIDIDISSARRREVLDWVGRTYSEAMTANRITYRLSSAIQDLGRALGIPPHLRNTLTKRLGRDYRALKPSQARKAKDVFTNVFGDDAPITEVLLGLLEDIEDGFVRHLAPHCGGVVLTKDALTNYSPIQVSTGGLSLLQFDKDDIEALGLIKLDLLGLRMLSALERARELIHARHNRWLDLGDLTYDDAVWHDIQQGDTMGLFQIESPAQVRMSVQLRPNNMIDLAHQIALVRPGPLQSGTVHPYVRRRLGKEPISYLHPCLEPILKKSYGTLLFQEDVLRIAKYIAGMSWIEADKFRKAVSKASADARDFITRAMHSSNLTQDQATALFDMLHGFQGYGFAESHAWAFAQHAYASAYLRHHYPAEYMASILTERPGMWSANTLRQESRRYGIKFKPININTSGLSYKVIDEPTEQDMQTYLLPPLTQIDGVSTEAARYIIQTRLNKPILSFDDAYARLDLPTDTWEALIRAGAFNGKRHELLYALHSKPHRSGQQPLFNHNDPAPLPNQAFATRFAWDFDLKHFSEHEVHPLDLVRRQLLDMGVTSLTKVNYGDVLTAGMVVAKQKPPTAKGFAFFMLEDGSTRAQLTISPQLWTEHREMLQQARILITQAHASKQGQALSLRAAQLWVL